MRNLRLVIFLGKLNLELWRADTDNAYLEAVKEERLYNVAGQEFEDLKKNHLPQSTLWLKIIWKTKGRDFMTFSGTWISSLHELTLTYG